MPELDEHINLNGEFLGVSSLAIYSAPIYLQLPLLLLVALLFFLKISQHSKEIKAQAEKIRSDNTVNIDAVLSEFNRFFFGFSVSGKNLSAYWVGFLIYLITLVHTLWLTGTQLL